MRLAFGVLLAASALAAPAQANTVALVTGAAGQVRVLPVAALGAGALETRVDERAFGALPGLARPGDDRLAGRPFASPSADPVMALVSAGDAAEARPVAARGQAPVAGPPVAAASSVPELALWAMMMIGLGLVSGTMRTGRAQDEMGYS